MEWILQQLGAPPALQGQPWHLIYENPAPTWLWLVGFIVIFLLPTVSYTNIRGTIKARTLLASLRIIALLFVAFMAMQPALEWPQEKRESDFVEVLVDSSSSLQVKDSINQQGSTVSRAEVAKNILNEKVWDTIAQEHKIEWVSVTGTSQVVQDRQSMPQAQGNRTLLASALSETLQRNLGRTLSAVVVISDGRSQDAVQSTTLRQIQSLGVPIFTIPLGDPSGMNDQAILSVEAPQSGFLLDQIPIQAQVSTRKPNEKIRVVLREKETRTKIDEQNVVSDSDGKANVTLIGQGSKAGSVVWEVATDGTPDIDQSNDTQRVDITFVDRSIRVLYLDGWPRWEFRYIKNILLREKGIESSIMLLSADRDFAQEGTTPLSRLPKTEKEFSVFDVIILGDVPAGFLSTTQQKSIQELVAKRGVGLLWIAGERSTPSSWRGAPLEDLLPFRGSLDLPRIDRPVYMQPTEAAARIGLLRLGNQKDMEESWPPELSSSGEPWAKLEWVQRIETRDLKPTAEVLANAVAPSDPSTPKNTETNGPIPMVLTMRYGSGQTTYVATDETWRWRHGRGETLPERFWVQIIRHLARAGLRNSAGISLLVDPPRANTNQPVRIVVDLAGATLNDTVVVEARSTTGGKTIDITLKPEGGDRFSCVWSAPSDGAGVWKLKIRQPQVAESPEANLTIIQEDTERIEALPDHDFLQKLSAATNGQFLSILEIDKLEKLIPRRSFITRQPIRMPLWNQWIFYAFFVVVIATEWIGRKIMKLV